MTDSHITKALLLNHLPEEVLTYIRQGVAGLSVELITPPEDKRETLLSMAAEIDVLIGWASDIELLKASKRLKLYINPGTGIQQHLEHFRKLRETRAVPLVNGHGNSYAVAQHTVALLLSLTNQVIPHHLGMAENQGRIEPSRTSYLRHKTIGLLSYGEINTNVHRFLSGFDVTFAAYRRRWETESGPFPTEIEKFSEGELEPFFANCDIVINSLPDTSRTRGIVTLKELTALGGEGLFVNVGRGNTVVQEDLYLALRDRVIAGAALDVWWKRVPGPEQVDTTPYSFPFHELDNLVMSPHRAADSGGNLDRWDEVIENLKRVQAGRSDFLNLVDLDREY